MPDGFPPGTASGTPDDLSTTGIVHLAAGAIGFLALAAAFFVVAWWFTHHRDATMATGSRVAAGLVFVTFAGGAATATTTAGVLLLWVAVLTSWVWLAVVSIALYRTIPHPDADRRGGRRAHDGAHTT